MTSYDDVFYQSSDGLTLYARDYNPVKRAPLTLLCLHGLTRNSADFAEFADHMADRYRVIAADQRGRGRSAHDPDPDRYGLSAYVNDMWNLLDHLQVKDVVVVGTSMGGLMAILMALGQPGRIRGMILNDIGPEVDPAGVARIASYAGKMDAVASWPEAAARVAAINGPYFPDFKAEDWLRVAQATYQETADGALAPAYDPNITKSLGFLRTDQQDLWPLFAATGAVPTLAIRGALSDILSDATLQKMQQNHPLMTQATIRDRGHAPFLTEADALAPIEKFLEQRLSAAD